MKIEEIIFDKETKTKFYGKLHGVLFNKTNEDFQVSEFLDYTNERIKVLDYEYSKLSSLIDYLDFMGKENNLSKILFNAREKDWEKLQAAGYLLEGQMRTYFKGSPVFCMSRFMTSKRQTSNTIHKENEIIENILKSKVKPLKGVLPPTGYSVKTAAKTDITELIKLYDEVFSTYPTPLKDPAYLDMVMDNNVIFKTILWKGKIVSAASAEMDLKNLNAEITDCATHPRFRSNGLVSVLISELEKEMASRGIITLYSLTRALSKGMNIVFYKFGYNQQGKFINNCHICNNFENMNLWAKELVLLH
ncbi:putative beta-lysine N-acetyltransferase [Desulfitibacter alkalitolerans]|uniref:putative beta-lysine N-acetyltransferase n=1 Tax=Desulfitibacter alkalitolerans TaxID=264641 RepID=UPI000683F125|nr:putative beta-lysine N-acetyltransferase [Desulfitibacter alkalitolerans]